LWVRLLYRRAVVFGESGMSEGELKVEKVEE
jgi:hypothetical protein